MIVILDFHKEPLKCSSSASFLKLLKEIHQEQIIFYLRALFSGSPCTLHTVQCVDYIESIKERSILFKQFPFLLDQQKLYCFQSQTLQHTTDF